MRVLDKLKVENRTLNKITGLAPRNVQEMTTEKGMTKIQRDIVFLIREDENITIKELCKKLNRGNTKVKQELAELKKEGYISREGAAKNGRWIVLV
jgi:predicted HTH transcriptional regulator